MSISGYSGLLLLFRQSFEKHRYYRQCPIRGCKAKPQKKLSNHIIYAHQGVSTPERKRLLARAVRIPLHEVKGGGQAKLTFGSKPSTSSPSVPTTSTTSKSLSKYPPNHSELKVLAQHLQELDGGRRSEKTTHEVITTIGKFAYFCDPKSFQWEYLSDTKRVSNGHILVYTLQCR